jgi:predicted dehydrogenase
VDKNKIKVALLGLGRIGQMHAKNLIENREFELKYVFDLNKDLLKKIANKYNLFHHFFYCLKHTYTFKIY